MILHQSLFLPFRLLAYVKFRSKLAIFAERKNAMTVVSLLLQLIGSWNSLSTFSAGTPTTKMEPSMYMHPSCPRGMSTQVDTNFAKKRFTSTECSQVSSVWNDIRIGQQ